MNNLIIFGLLILLLLAAQFSTAKPVEEIIDKYLGARGGKDKLEGVKRIYMEGIIDKMGSRSNIKIIKEEGKLSSFEIQNDMANRVASVTGYESGRLFPERSGLTGTITEHELAVWQTDLDIAGHLVDYSTKGYQAELLGKETLEGNTCYKIKLTTGAGLELMFWVDTITYLLTQSSSIDTVQDDQKYIFILYKNYKEVDGIQFAHSFEIIRTMNNTNKTAEMILFHKILVNPSIDL